MKILKKITINFNSDSYESTTEIVSVSDKLSNAEVVKAYLNRRRPSYVEKHTSEWTVNTYKEYTEDYSFINTYSVITFIPEEI